MTAEEQKLNNVIKRYGLPPDTIFTKQKVRLIKKIGIDKIVAQLESPVEMQLAYINGMSVVVKATCVADGTKYTSFGEVNPQNNKFPYPVAMAEKRSRSRVVLSALGIHGYVYGEEEIDFAIQADKILDKRAQAAQDSEENVLKKIKKQKHGED